MKTNLESITWKGGRGRFENLVKSSQLKRGHIYFVGDYKGSELGGLEQSNSGVINVAISERLYVSFGTFDLKDLEKRITDIEQRLEELGGNVDELIKDVVTLGGKVSEIGSKVSTIEEGAEKNKINVVERNGQAITPTEDKVINILVPVNTSELNNDSKYQTDADVAETIVGVNLNVASGIITLTRKNGTTFTIDLPTEKVIKSGYYDGTSEEIVLVLADDSEIRFSASQLIDEYYADNVTLEQYTDTADGNKKKFRIKTSYKNKIDGAEQTSNKTASVTSSSTATQYPSALAVWNAIKDFATKVQTFSQASTRANIESGETISIVFGKIKKWFADLKEVAFSGSYNDLSNKPTIAELASLEPDSTEESFTDTQKIIASMSSGEWEKAYSKTALMMWNYIKSKIESVLGLTESNYKGSAKYLYTIKASRNNNKVYKLLGTYEIPNTAYWNSSFSLYVQGIHNINFTETYLVNVSVYSSETLNPSARLTYPLSLPNTYLPILGEVYDRKLYLYVRNEMQVHASYSVSILNDVDKRFTIETQNKYYDSSTPNGGTLAKLLYPYLEITDSNLSNYYDSSTEILKNIHDVAKVIAFKTTNQIKVSAIQFANTYKVENGRRLTLIGNFSPSQLYSSGNTDGRFSSYLYVYRGGSIGSQSSFTGQIKEAFEDFIYFNGIWYSKGY
jgi:hypothetical protein